jgi:hypothetical protein
MTELMNEIRSGTKKTQNQYRRVTDLKQVVLDEEAVSGGRRVDDDGRDLAVLELKAELRPQCYKTF